MDAGNGQSRTDEPESQYRDHLRLYREGRHSADMSEMFLSSSFYFMPEWRIC
jgi:hypothetical protein